MPLGVSENNQALRLCEALHNLNNWLFADTIKGAKASANLYSLVDTAKLNGLEPYRYLHHILKELPKAQALEDIESLLPWQVDKAHINSRWKNGWVGFASRLRPI